MLPDENTEKLVIVAHGMTALDSLASSVVTMLFHSRRLAVSIPPPTCITVVNASTTTPTDAFTRTPMCTCAQAHAHTRALANTHTHTESIHERGHMRNHRRPRTRTCVIPAHTSRHLQANARTSQRSRPLANRSTNTQGFAGPDMHTTCMHTWSCSRHHPHTRRRHTRTHASNICAR